MVESGQCIWLWCMFIRLSDQCFENETELQQLSLPLSIWIFSGSPKRSRR